MSEHVICCWLTDRVYRLLSRSAVSHLQPLLSPSMTHVPPAPTDNDKKRLQSAWRLLHSLRGVFGAVALLLLLLLVLRARIGAASVKANAPRTLIVIHGPYRTLDYTVDSIIWNLVEANAPCDVVLVTPRCTERF